MRDEVFMRLWLLPRVALYRIDGRAADQIRLEWDTDLFSAVVQVVIVQEGIGRGEWIRTTDLLVPNQAL